jgi:hypothetical protein
MHWTLGMPSANALWLGDARWSSLAQSAIKHFAQHGLEFFLLSNRIHARPSAQ